MPQPSFTVISALVNEDLTDAFTYATDFWTPAIDKVYYFGIASRYAGGTAEVPVPVGNNLTFTQVSTVLSNTNHRRLTVFRAVVVSPATPGTGTISWTYAAIHHHAQWGMVECGNCLITGTAGADNTVEVAKCADNLNVASPTCTLAGIAANNKALVFAESVATGSSTTDPTTGLSTNNSAEGRMLIFESASDATPTANFSSANHCEIIAIEVAGTSDVSLEVDISANIAVPSEAIPSQVIDRLMEYVLVEDESLGFYWTPTGPGPVPLEAE